MQNTIQKSNLFAGIRGSLSSKYTFNLSASFQKLDSMYFFSPDNTSSYGNKFQLQYDNLFQTTFMAEIAYQDFEKDDIIPIHQLTSRPQTFIMELFHGPTISFKDIGLAFLVNLVNYFLKRKNDT